MATATEVYQALHSEINSHSKTLDIWAAIAKSALQPLKPVLELFGITASYSFTKVDLKPVDGEKVTLLASATFGQPGASAPTNKFTVAVTLIFTATTGVFTLTFKSTKSTILLSNLFLTLPATLRSGDLDSEEEGAIRWYDSILKNMTIDSATFSADSTTGATLMLSGALQEPDDDNIKTRLFLLGTWPLNISGSVVMPTGADEPPLLDLKATGSSLTLQAGRAEGINDGPSAFPIKAVGLNLIVNELATPQFDHTHFSTLRIYGDVALGAITGTISTLILSTGNTWSFSITFRKNATFVQGLSQLTDLFGVEIPVPMNFPVLSDFYLAEIDIDLQNKNAQGTMPSLSLGGFAITIKSEKIWHPPVPFVTVSNVGTRWVWVWTEVAGSQPNTLKKSYLLSGSVFGTLNFGDSSDGDATVLRPPQDGNGGSGHTGGGGGTLVPLAPSFAEVGGNGVAIDVSMSIPNFIIKGNMQPGDYIPIGKAFTYFFGVSGPTTAANMNVTSFSFTADPIGQNYSGQAVILFGDPLNPAPGQGWALGPLTLQQLELFINAEGGKISGGITGIVMLEDGTPSSDYTKPRLMISAEYPTQNPEQEQGWVFSGKLYEGTSIHLTKLVKKLVTGSSEDPPSWVPDLNVDRLYGSFNSGNKAYNFGGSISALWSPTIFGTQLKVAAAASIDMIRLESEEKANGKISGQFSVNKIALSAAMNFGDKEPIYQFKIQFDQLWLEAVTSWRGKNNARHQVVSIQLGGVTLGDMIEYLVNLAAPTLGFQLDSPWDVLKRIDLSRFVLTIDPVENTVEFIFKANVNLAIMQIDTVGIRYTKGTGAAKVNMIITGDFVGKTYKSGDPLSWDVINDPPPSVPGEGKSLVDLRYIGLGQRVTFSQSQAELPDTVAGLIATLKAAMKPPAKGQNKNPIAGQTGIKYDPDSQWLIGLDITLMETLAVGIIFNDPKLYGLSVALSGEKAGALAGLDFELLYKKITNDVGMFRVELKVPEVFRTIQLGVASLTLGTIVVEVYTNGNFKVDFGFPYNRDFSRSFSMSYQIFIGRGGIYFGLLDGTTSSQVPKITNGNFSPVLELGLGLAAGVGKELHAGLFSGGIYVELEVVFQGVLGWFHPSSSGQEPAKFFACKGIVAIHGKVYGSVNFVLINVSVTIDAYVQALAIYQCYEPTFFKISAEVSAEAKIKVIFVTIHFSFNFHIETSFTIGSSSQTPWILAPGSGKGGFKQDVRINPPLRKALLRSTHMAKLRHLALKRASVGNITAMMIASFEDATYNLTWNPSKNVFGLTAPKIAHLTMLPLFSIKDVPVSWSDTVPVNNAPIYRSAFVLTADTGIDSSSYSVAECRERSGHLSPMVGAEGDTSGLAADILVQGLFLYVIDAIPRPSREGDIITAGQLAHLEEELSMSETMEQGFSLTSLNTFFEKNINIVLTGDPEGEPDDKGVMSMPMPPWMSFEITTSSGSVTTDFMDTSKIGSLYEYKISKELGKYSPVDENNATRPTNDNPDNYESFASFIFRDFCLMIAKNTVKEAEKQMTKTKVVVEKNNENISKNLDEIAKDLPSATVTYVTAAGNTIDSVAVALGTTVEELLLLNATIEKDIEKKPGTVLDVLIGVSPFTLAEDNATVEFAKGQWPLGTIYHTAQEGSKLADIATLFNATVEKILSFTNLKRVTLRADPNLLKATSSFNLAQRTFTAGQSTPKERIAATFFSRYLGLSKLRPKTGPDVAGWYSQAIASKFAENIPALTEDGEFVPGTKLTVPSKYNAAASSTNDYYTVAGDTLLRIGATLALQQDDVVRASEKTSWQTFLAGVINSSGNIWLITKFDTLMVEVGETVESLARRLVIDASYANESWTYQWPAIAVWIGPSQVLATLAVVPVPKAKTKDAIFSFKSLSTIYGISIADTLDALHDQVGLFVLGTSLTVNHLPAQKISVLTAALLEGDSFTAIVNQSSRMLMAGLQLPSLETKEGHTVPDVSQPQPLYDLTGQQFNVPVDGVAPTANALMVVSTSNAPWITQMNSITVAKGTTQAQMNQLEIQYPLITKDNPSLSGFTYPLAHSVVLLTGSVGPLQFKYSKNDIIKLAPATGLAVQPALAALPENLWPMPLVGETFRTYNFEYRIDLQTSTALPIPALIDAYNKNGHPALWPFPEGFIHQALSGATSHYEILTSTAAGAAGRHANALAHTTFAVTIPFRIAKLGDGSERFNLLGVDTDKRHLLLSLKKQLLSEESGTLSYLLLAPSPNASQAAGLTVLPSTMSATYIVKSNLSTESVPQPTLNFMDFMVEEPVYFASLASLAEFLLLMWEGSVVGGTGYYFGLNEKLPGSAFDSHGVATLQLLVVPKSQQAAASEGRKLLPCNNILMVGAGLTNAVHSLYAESYTDTDMVKKAMLPPGNVGFRIATDKPLDVHDPVAEKEVHLRKLFSMMSYQIAKVMGSPFAVAESGMPALPKPWDGNMQTAAVKEKTLRFLKAKGEPVTAPTNNYWLYEQVMPVYKFLVDGTALAVPAVTGLPDVDKDPYAGFGLLSSIPAAHFSFGFGDVLGNRAEPPSAGQGALALPCGYTDSFIGIGEWPSTTSDYTISAQADLTASIYARPSEIVPGASQAGDYCVQDAQHQAQKYAQSYYQLVQKGIEGYIETTLNNTSGGLKLDTIAPLIQFAASSYAYATTVASVSARHPAPDSTLADVVDTFHIRYGELAAANKASLVPTIFITPASLVVPSYFPFVENDTAISFVALHANTWPEVTAETLLSAPENNKMSLNTGAVLAVTSYGIPTASVQPTPSLKTLADNNNSTADLLAVENSSKAILAEGFTFVVESGSGHPISVKTNATRNTLKAIVDYYKSEYGVHLTVSALVSSDNKATKLPYSETEGLLAANVSLNVTSYVVKEGDSFVRNSSKDTVAKLIEKNLTSVNIFDPGTLLFFGDFSSIDYGDVPPTLQAFAEKYACPVALLLQANATAKVGAINVPGVFSWPEHSDALTVPYSIMVNDTLTSIAANFATTAADGGLIAQENLLMPGIFTAKELTITVQADNKQYKITPVAASSFAAVLTQLKAADYKGTLDDIVTSITGETGVLQPGSLLLCPLAKLSKLMAPSDLAALYGITAEAFALVNSATPSLIAAVSALKSVDGKVTIASFAGDTFNSLIARFADHQVKMDAASIVKSNQTIAFLAKDALALLAPTPAKLTVNVGTAGPYPGPIFPLNVSLKLTRPAALIATGFEVDGPVAQTSAMLPAPADGGKSKQDSLNFNQFAKDMKAAFPALRLGTAKVEGETSDLWCVDFTQTGIKKVTLKGGSKFEISGQQTPQPRYISLKPLCNSLVFRTDVPIKPLTATGGLGSATAKNYQGIDVEIWAERFLGDVDRILSGGYATALYENTTMQASLKNIIGYKASLTTRIANRLDYLLDIDHTGGAKPLESAISAMEQQLAVNLSKAFDTSVLIQYDSVVESAWQSRSLDPANLYGEGAISPSADLTILSAKTHLDDANAYVNFLTTVQSPSRHKELSGKFTYNISHVEFDIKMVDPHSKYVASNWISFLPPLVGDEKPAALKNTDPTNDVHAPVPLRTFPQLPVIKGQAATAVANRTVLADYSQWDYHFTYSHEHAEQDFVLINAEFNLTKPLNFTMNMKELDLFAALAQYMAVADGLWTKLEGLVNPASKVPAATLIQSMQTLSDLIEAIDTNWESIEASGGGQSNDKYISEYFARYEARIDYGEQEYTLKAMDHKTHDGNITWPTVTFIDENDKEYPLKLTEPVLDNKAVYTSLDHLFTDKTTWPTFRLVFTDMNVSTIQNARCGIAVERNQSLISNSTVKTNPAFLFKTAQTYSAGIATPLLSASNRLPLTNASTLQKALNDTITTLFPAQHQIANLSLTLGIFYAYELNKDEGNPANSLITRLPVALYPDQPISADIGSQVSAIVDTWIQENKPSMVNGEWVFSLVLYSHTDQEKYPLLTLEQLYYASD